MNLICPNCNARLSLEALAEDADARKLFGLLAQHEQAAGAMVQYLQLFKPPKQALRWARALRLATELLVIADRAGCLDDQLAEACLRTVAAMEGKRARGDWQPLNSHRYFEKVLAAVQDEFRGGLRRQMDEFKGKIKTTRGQAPSKRSEALRLLDED